MIDGAGVVAPHPRHPTHDRRHPSPEIPVMTNVIRFVGTHRDHPDYLLLFGAAVDPALLASS